MTQVSFNDSLAQDVDCSFLWRGTLAEPLRDPGFLPQVRVDRKRARPCGQTVSTRRQSLLHGDYEPAVSVGSG